MKKFIQGIHHVTAIASDPQTNLDFYAGLLGLRFVKKTVNFDDPTAYHLYYGDTAGTPGSIVTFFTWVGGVTRGRVGSGQTTRLSFSAAPAALVSWRARLEVRGVAVTSRTRFGEDVLAFADPDGIPVEIVAVAADPRRGWDGAGIPVDHALRGLYTAELTVRDSAPTENLITGEMGYRLVRRDGRRARFEAGAGGPGTYIDVIADPDGPTGLGGVGTIHHIAWRLADDDQQRAVGEALARGGFDVSPVRDRTYFRSIYYRERGGILFEVATDIPGFADDEALESLGNELKLPRQFERARQEIEKLLPPLQPAKVLAETRNDVISTLQDS